MSNKPTTLPIEQYGVIGDCETAALVGKNGSIDWLCWPSFSADSCFAALLGDADNGRWLIAPEGKGWTSAWRYRPGTLILETTWTRRNDTVRVTDFMPARHHHSHVCRKVECLSGSATIGMELAIRFDYGRSVPWVTRADGVVKAVSGPHMTLLRTEAKTFGEDQMTCSSFKLRAGHTMWFTLSYGKSYVEPPHAFDPEKSLAEADAYWQKWSAKCTPAGKYSAAVQRSLITLKALTYRPTGGVVAAVTTSLPESIGGPRNWDYRFCWLRDSTFTLLALMNGGFYKEAEAWEDWLHRAIAGSPDQVQIMYGISGERQLQEWEVPWLKGYENSKPVRIGNAASEQLQLDIYGEVMDAFFHSLAGLKKSHPDNLQLQKLLVNHLGEIWKQPDQGIWESRGGAKQYTYSKMMAWVAFDRAIAIAEQTKSDAPLEKWRTLRKRIHDEVCRKGFNKRLNAFTQTLSGKTLDSSLLLMPLVGFLPPTDPRVLGTIAAIEKGLMKDGLLLRYDTGKSKDGLPAGEGAFLACSFWLVSCLKMTGRDGDAEALLERLLSLRNELGLYSEEYDTRRKRQVGNTPQAFSHIAMINAIFDVVGSDESSRKRHHRKSTVPTSAKNSGPATPELDPKPAQQQPS